MTNWKIQDSIDLYHIQKWGSPFFGINSKGNTVVYPFGDPNLAIDIWEIIKDLKSQKIDAPFILRFPDILGSCVRRLTETFASQIKKFSYQKKYFGVYPVKVNHLSEVVEEILAAGQKSHFGLEVGSKAEMALSLAYNTNSNALTICNGYKDEAYLKLVMLGRKLGRQVIVVIERLNELKDLLKIAKEHQVTPLIGLRAKLSAKGFGKWVQSSGDYAKFGLTAPEIIKALDLIKKAGMQESLKLLHFHLGSQLSDIRAIKNAVIEGARLYVQLHRMGFAIEYFDVGGGLGVQYDGSYSTKTSSMNYSLEEYCADIIYELKRICDLENIPQPHIVSESGRALSAYHSVLVMNAFDVVRNENQDLTTEQALDDGDLIYEMGTVLKEVQKPDLNQKKLQESYHDALGLKEECLARFNLGFINLAQRAQVESLYWKILKAISQKCSQFENLLPPIQKLNAELTDQYLANFSVFQSAPDHWAFKQLFPIMPLHRLDQQPKIDAKLVDITCDSDGKIEEFIDPNQTQSKSTLRLHSIDGKPYYLGMFLTGAYQDIMGDMHNLFGRLHEAHIFCDQHEPQNYYIKEIIDGQTIAQSLEQVQYHPQTLNDKLKKQLENKAKLGDIKPKQTVEWIRFYEEVLNSYPYLSDPNLDFIDSDENK